jgi:hypothetical protein
MRYVDQTSASIWVETRDPATVTVRAGARSGHARTFGAHGHHYALVCVDGLEPGSVTPYDVEVDGEHVWPPQGATYPSSVIATLKPDKPLRLAYGSCRTSVPHDAEGNRVHGVDALRALALRMAHEPQTPWPDLMLFLGDQVYADETSEQMREFIATRRSLEEPPGPELKDFEEYAHLYALAWSEPANRWLLSTLPSAMIFDDHDVRDDWNTSQAWRQRMEREPWWQERIVSGLGSYWVYQHLGNLSPDERAKDALWQQVLAHDGPDELDLTAALDAFAETAYRDAQAYRWSFARDVAGNRLVVVDSRAARRLLPGNRSMLDTTEMEWLDGQMRGGFRHLLVATSVPFLLPPALHHAEAWNEAVCDGAWGSRAARAGERLREAVDLEHWAAFQRGFREVAGFALEVAEGRRGPAPRTVTFLSGDVHHSYLTEVRRARRPGESRVLQAVCSPIRNPLSRGMRMAMSAVASALTLPVGRRLSRAAKVPPPPFEWGTVAGPWFDNSVATLEDGDDGLVLTWETGVVHGDPQRPRLEQVARVVVD